MRDCQHLKCVAKHRKHSPQPEKFNWNEHSLYYSNGFRLVFISSNQGKQSIPHPRNLKTSVFVLELTLYSSFAVTTVTLHFNRVERVKRSRFLQVTQHFYSSAEGSVLLCSLANKAVLLPMNVKYSIRQPGVVFSLINLHSLFYIKQNSLAIK